MEQQPKSSEEALRQAVLVEIEEEKKRMAKHKDTYLLQQVMNNMVLRLPNQVHEEGSWRMRVIPREKWDIPHATIASEDPEAKSMHSELFWNQTPREFFQTLQEAIEKNPAVQSRRVMRLTNLYFAERDSEKAWVTLQRLYEYLLPVYIDLRVKGYSWSDLSG